MFLTHNSFFLFRLYLIISDNAVLLQLSMVILTHAGMGNKLFTIILHTLITTQHFKSDFDSYSYYRDGVPLL